MVQSGRNPRERPTHRQERNAMRYYAGLDVLNRAGFPGGSNS